MKSADDFAVLCVDPARIEEIWPHVVEFIAAAFDNGRGDDCADDVHGDLLAQRALLWVVWDGEAIIVAATTKLINTARGLICVITSCGGREMGIERWRIAIKPIEDYAKREGCAFIRVEGRRGWQAVFPDYREAWVALEKRL
jgi:hypothetical protein